MISLKIIILAGGFGTRISEESQFKPKPMVELGGMPILWHIMKLYSHHGFHEFIICAGYKQHQGVLRGLLPAHLGRYIRFHQRPK